MRTLVCGAGPLGSCYAARLHEAGAEVALLARGPRLDDLHNHGVVIEDVGSDQRETYVVPFVEELNPEDRYDLVLVVMRNDHSAAILPTLVRNRHVSTFLFVQNTPRA